MGITQFLPHMFPLKTGIIIFSLISVLAANLQIHRIESPIEALLGHDIVLPCHFYDYKTSPLDLTKVSVRWTMKTSETKEERVYFFDGTNHIPNRTGSYIPDSRLMEGYGGLHLPNLQFSDEGEYTCNVIVTPDKATSKVTLQISAKPICSLSDSRMEMNPNTERSVSCYVNGYHPNPVKIQWVKYSKASFRSELDSQTCTTVPVLSQDGTYNVTNVLSVKPMSTEEDGDRYSCEITHRSLKHGLTCSVILSVATEEEYNNILWISVGIGATVVFILVAVVLYFYCIKASPIVSEITKEDFLHSEKKTVKCSIFSFRPYDLTIKLYLNTTEICSWNSKKNKNKTQKNNNELELVPQCGEDRTDLRLDPIITRDKILFFNCICDIHITPMFSIHDGAVLTVEIQHASLQFPIYKYLALSVQTPPILDLTDKEKRPYKVGEQLDLECRIHSFFPKSIKVLWYKDTEIISKQTFKGETKENGLYYVMSSVRHIIKKEDFGKTFRCHVKHKFTSPEPVCWVLEKKDEASSDSSEIKQENSNGNQQ
ncbi:uncharacterized protein ACNLHF_006952 [Anomaloglossus baeobatrachus]|uniref:uncharacterized protein LOC142254306 n=1 Tax=Anomaloglossus baeobatrachus TaxID=238106 RepID=UPI003F506DD8